MPSSRVLRWAPALLLACCVVLAACSSTYYRALETIGIEKRDVLVDRIEDAQSSQEAAKEQFDSALEQYRSLVNFDGGDLESLYDRLDGEYEKSKRRAEQVEERIDAVRDVAGDLFDEWESELGEYSDDQLRRRSRALLDETKSDYADLMVTMERAEESMAPVLSLFQDQVLILRHNLNARAIGSLDNELATIEAATSRLIADMEQSIAEARRFVRSL